MICNYSKKIACLLGVISLAAGASIIQNDEFQVKAVGEALDPARKYLLSWQVDLTKGEVTFEIEVETKGYVGLGVSPGGNMIGADIFIGGVTPDGKSYGHDMHAESTDGPIEDQHSDWNLLEAREDATKTYLKVSRVLVTCDDEDYPILNDTIRLIWAYGESDDIRQHSGTNRGTKSTNLVTPDLGDFNPDDYEHWDVEMNIEMPEEDTSYWCNIQKAPALNETHHIVAFMPLLNNELALTHTHHFVIYRCHTPEGQNPEDIFEQFVGDAGESCYTDTPRLPIDLCMGSYIYIWSKGGSGMIFPKDVGHPFPHKVGQSNYYLFEIHYDNPEKLSGKKFPTGARVLYTDKLRKIDAGLVTVAHDVGITTTVPPNQTEFIVTGHCSSECTQKSLSDDGIKVFDSLLHSHLSGATLQGSWLKWLDNEQQYDFNFQQNKALMEHVEVKRGDQLTIECVYNTAWLDNRVVVGGLSTRHEMCMAFLWYYPMQDFEYCASHYPEEEHFAEFGITKYSSYMPPGGGLPQYMIEEPADLAGNFEDSMNTKFKWNSTFIKELERRGRYNRHISSCGHEADESQYVQFPDDFEKYIPEEVCKRQTPGGGGNSGSVMLKSSSLLITAIIAKLITF